MSDFSDTFLACGAGGRMVVVLGFDGVSRCLARDLAYPWGSVDGSFLAGETVGWIGKLISLPSQEYYHR